MKKSMIAMFVVMFLMSSMFISLTNADSDFKTYTNEKYEKHEYSFYYPSELSKSAVYGDGVHLELEDEDLEILTSVIKMLWNYWDSYEDYIESCIPDNFAHSVAQEVYKNGYTEIVDGHQASVFEGKGKDGWHKKMYFIEHNGYSYELECGTNEDDYTWFQARYFAPIIESFSFSLSPRKIPTIKVTPRPPGGILKTYICEEGGYAFDASDEFDSIQGGREIILGFRKNDGDEKVRISVRKEDGYLAERYRVEKTNGVDNALIFASGELEWWGENEQQYTYEIEYRFRYDSDSYLYVIEMKTWNKDRKAVTSTYLRPILNSFRLISVEEPTPTPSPTIKPTPTPTPEPEQCVKYYNYEGEQKYPDHFIDGYSIHLRFPDNRMVPWNSTDGVFDCSEMAAMYEWYFENKGYHAKIKTSRKHVWVVLERSDKTWVVWEATEQRAVLNETLINEKYKKFNREFETIRDAQEAEKRHFVTKDDFDWWNNFDEYKDTKWCKEPPNPIEVPGFEAVFVIAVLSAVAYLLRRRGKV